MQLCTMFSSIYRDLGVEGARRCVTVFYVSKAIGVECLFVLVMSRHTHKYNVIIGKEHVSSVLEQKNLFNGYI